MRIKHASVVPVATFVFGLGLGAAALALAQPDKPKPAYMLVSGTVINSEGLEAYGAKAGPLARAAGLEVVARGEVKVMEGSWSHPSVVTVERFESMAALENFWYSDGYQAAIKLREGKFKADFIVAVEGI